MFSSVGGHLYSNESGVASVTSVASVDVTNLTDDDTGQVVSGALTLRGKLVQVLLEKSTGKWNSRYLVAAWRVQRFETAQGDSLECNFDEGRGAFGGPRILFDTEEDVSECVLFLPILVVIHTNSKAFYRGLLLVSSGSDHRRVGFMDITLYGTLEEMEEYEVRIV